MFKILMPAKASNRKLTATIKLVNERIDRLQEVTSETVSSRQLNVWATIGGILAALQSVSGGQKTVPNP